MTLRFTARLETDLASALMLGSVPSAYELLAHGLLELRVSSMKLIEYPSRAYSPEYSTSRGATLSWLAKWPWSVCVTPLAVMDVILER
jgi:hypothetical protein